MEKVKQTDIATLRSSPESGKEVSILDVGPIQEKAEWFIPGSIHINAYEKPKPIITPEVLNPDYEKRNSAGA